jgi:hypothetical protein
MTSPQIGDFKRKIRFAFFPVKIEGKLLWLKRYVKVWEYKEFDWFEDVEVSSGGLEDVATSIGLLNNRTVRIHNRTQLWDHHSNEPLKTKP